MVDAIGGAGKAGADMFTEATNSFKRNYQCRIRKLHQIGNTRVPE